MTSRSLSSRRDYLESTPSLGVCARPKIVALANSAAQVFASSAMVITLNIFFSTDEKSNDPIDL